MSRSSIGSIRLARCLVVALAVALASALGVGTARADDEPLARTAGTTSGAASLLSGRTLGSGEVMLAAFAGWPGAGVEAAFAPLSELNVHARARVLYGAPLLGLVTGLGGELAVPIRVHVLGEGQLDLSIRVTPRVSVGEGRLFGEPEGLAGALGVGFVCDASGVLGYALDPDVTFFAGLGGSGGGSSVEGSSMGFAWVARVVAELGMEALFSRDLLFFARVEAGYGFAPDRAGLVFYPAREILELTLGVGYLL